MDSLPSALPPPNEYTYFLSLAFVAIIFIGFFESSKVTTSFLSCKMNVDIYTVHFLITQFSACYFRQVVVNHFW